jgi:hypothetical protein
MEIILPSFNGAIEFLIDSVMQIYNALYITFGNSAIWQLLSTHLEFTIPNIFGGEDIVVRLGILTMLFSYGLTSFIMFSLWKWVKSAIK